MAIQIIEEKPNFGQLFAQGIGRGLSGQSNSAVSQIGAFLGQQKAQEALQKQQLAQMQQENKAFPGLSGLTDPKMRQVALGEMLKQSGKEKILGQKQDFLNKLFGGNQESDVTEGLPQTNVKKFDPSTISDEDIVKAASIDPTLERALRAAKDTALKEKRHTEDTQLQKDEKRRAETIPMKQKIAEDAQSAVQSIQNKEKQLEMVESGELNDPTFATVMDMLPGKLGRRFLSPKTVEYKASLVDEYKDLRAIFQGQTRVKEIELLEDKIADTYYTDDQKKAIIKARIAAADSAVIKAEVAAEIDQESPNLGILEFTKELNKRMKERLQTTSNQVIDMLKNVQNEADVMKSRPLDVGNPQDAQIMKQILEEAGGDVSKAYKLAAKKGYKVKR